MPTSECCAVSISLHALSQACQSVAGIVEDLAAAVDVQRIAAHFRGLPAPGSRVEALAVEGLLIRFTEQLVPRLHARVHGHSTEAACGFSPNQYRLDLDAASSVQQGTLDQRMSDWMPRLLAALRSTRPRRAAVSRRRVALESGESPCRCRIRKKVARAIHLLRTTDWKIEAIAWEVGWRSKKDLYVQIKRATGLTPGQLRRASAETIAALTGSTNTHQRPSAA